MYNLYAADTHLYISFKMSECSNAVAQMEDCISIIRTWKSSNFLKLHDSKREVLFLGTPIMLAKFSKPSVKIDMEDIGHSDSARNIGAIFDSTVEMKE